MTKKVYYTLSIVNPPTFGNCVLTAEYSGKLSEEKIKPLLAKKRRKVLAYYSTDTGYSYIDVRVKS